MAGEGPPLDVENPATEKTVATVRAPSAEQLDAALTAAREAAAEWGATPALERAEMLQEVAARMRARTHELAEVMTLEGGKPLLENSDEVGWTAAAFSYYAEMGRNFGGRVIPSIESTQMALVLKEPMGVVGAIVPWNYPLLLLSWKLAPALAAGNTVVAKPSELTPLSTLMLADSFDALPPGVVGLVAGGGDVGARIVEDERVDCVAFTGSVETGKKVAAACAERVARVNLEMGGKDPFIVCADVASEVEVAARGGAWAAYLNAGQVCTSAERFYVAREIYDDYVEAFVDHARSLRVGDPMDSSTDVGPMVSAAQRDKVVRAGRGGGERRCRVGGGRRPRRARLGALLRARRGDGRGGRHRAAQRGDLRARGADRARRLRRRGHRPGQLDPLRARRQRLHPRPRDRPALRPRDQGGHGVDQRPAHRQRRRPLRGLQAVGNGRELGQEGLEAFQETKHAHIETNIEVKEWWYPY